MSLDAPQPSPIRALALRRTHRVSALIIVVFLVLHLANHLASLAGESAHIRTMETLRLLYRSSWIEPILLAAIAWQMVSGFALLVRGREGPRRGVARLKAISGVVLFLFLALHVTAVLTARSRGLDTNFHFAAAGFHFGSYHLFFAPYYLVAVISLFIHVACALYWRIGHERGTRLIAAATAAGAGVGAAVVLALAGAFYPVEIPVRYERLFGL